MDPVRASLTALGAAYRRAYHDAHDTPKVFEDRLAALFVSPDEATAIEDFPASWQEATPSERSHDSRTYTGFIQSMCKNRSERFYGAVTKSGFGCNDSGGVSISRI